MNPCVFVRKISYFKCIKDFFSLPLTVVRRETVPVDDLGRRHCVISEERGERTKQNAGHELEAFVKKNVGGFRYKPRGDWFSFAKVRKLCFICSCIQTLKTSISQRSALRIRPSSSARTASV